MEFKVILVAVWAGAILACSPQQYDAVSKKTETAEYDALVQSAKVDPCGCRTVFEYGDRLLLTRSVSDGLAPDVPSLDESRSYDHAGRLLTVTDAGDSRRNVSYVYDHLDRVTSETSADFTHSYGYDLAGNRTTVCYPEISRSMVSVYDHLNRLTKITETGGSPATSRETKCRYDLASNVLQREQANTITESNGYDPLDRRIFQRTLMGNTPVSLFASSHDSVGNVTRVEERFSSSTIPDRNVINVYDRQNRLMTEQADNLTFWRCCEQDHPHQLHLFKGEQPYFQERPCFGRRIHSLR